MGQSDLDIFCENIKWLRAKHNLSKQKMAQMLHISVRTLNRIEQGEVPPRISVDPLYWIYDHFGILPSEILGRHLNE